MASFISVDGRVWVLFLNGENKFDAGILYVVTASANKFRRHHALPPLASTRGVYFAF